MLHKPILGQERKLKLLFVIDTSADEGLDDRLKMLLLRAAIRGGKGDPGDRLVNASSNGNLQNVREILEANPDKVMLLIRFKSHGD